MSTSVHFNRLTGWLTEASICLPDLMAKMCERMEIPDRLVNLLVVTSSSPYYNCNLFAFSIFNFKQTLSLTFVVCALLFDLPVLVVSYTWCALASGKNTVFLPREFQENRKVFYALERHKICLGWLRKNQVNLFYLCMLFIRLTESRGRHDLKVS